MDFFDRFFAYRWEELPFVFLALMIAFTFHEFAHAYSAYKFGDPTAYRQGRVTLNPRVHLDIFGTILIFIAGFGWAKPVPVNRSMFSRPRLMGIIVSAVGPLSNLLIAFIAFFFYYWLHFSGSFAAMSSGWYVATETFLRILVNLNVLLFIFNLIPLPPLDGYRIIEDLAPPHIRARLSQVEHWGIYIFLLLVLIPPLYRATLMPILSLRNPILLWMQNFFHGIFS